MNKMVVDYSTKHIQSSLFIYQRNLILRRKYNEMKMYKMWYKEELERYNLQNEMKNDLIEL